MAETRQTFQVHGGTIKLEDAPIEPKQLQTILPPLSAYPHISISVQDDALQMLEQPIVLRVPKGVETSLSIAQETLGNMAQMKSTLEHLQLSIQSSCSVLQGLIIKLNTKLAFVGLDLALIAKIFSYCSAVPTELLFAQRLLWLQMAFT